MHMKEINWKHDQSNKQKLNSKVHITDLSPTFLVLALEKWSNVFDRWIARSVPSLGSNWANTANTVSIEPR